MKTRIKWRLADRPTPMEVRDLHTAGLLSKDEAREILFSHETEKDRDTKALESEVQFLRELVDKLAKGNTSTIVETIRYIEKPYVQWGWYQPYQVWCSGQALSSSVIQHNLSSATYHGGNTTTAGTTNMVGLSFRNIKTF